MGSLDPDPDSLEMLDTDLDSDSMNPEPLHYLLDVRQKNHVLCLYVDLLSCSSPIMWRRIW